MLISATVKPTISDTRGRRQTLYLQIIELSTSFTQSPLHLLRSSLLSLTRAVCVNERNCLRNCVFEPVEGERNRFYRETLIYRFDDIPFFQQNAGSILLSDIAHRLEMVCIMLQKLHCNVFMLSYRGYGASDGFPSEQGITMDVQAALDHLSQRTDINTSQIVVFRRSLGGAVGAVVTKNNPDKVAALILENTFTSILDMAGVILPFLKYFIGVSSSTSKNPKFLNFVVRSQWSIIDVIGQVLNFLHLEEHLGVRMCQWYLVGGMTKKLQFYALDMYVLKLHLKPQFEEESTIADLIQNKEFPYNSQFNSSHLPRVEIGDFIEYDLDNEDEDWLQDFNKERLILPAENISRSRGPMIMTLIVFEDIDATLYEDRGEPGRLQTQHILGNQPITHKEVELKAIKVSSVII
ncbi:hypothetical protein L2E82_43741 [Cichorium intybus]|uniref:Uncharacterized protein n=1 Tax=Cichorium intybus TaxID=13427 RepID=A0ACB8ZQ30_CICIN|nr:hypothetical protein L2E82_43741 [Cichorium intybus]